MPACVALYYTEQRLLLALLPVLCKLSVLKLVLHVLLRGLVWIHNTPARFPCKSHILSGLLWTGTSATCDARKLRQEQEAGTAFASASALAQALTGGRADAFAQAASRATGDGAQATAAAEALSQVAGQGQAQAAATALAQAASKSKYDGQQARRASAHDLQYATAMPSYIFADHATVPKWWPYAHFALGTP
jgi:hypothetical protein